jgi:hypothetical protein
MTIRHLATGLVMLLGAIAGVYAIDAFMEEHEADKHVEYQSDKPPE